MATTVGLHQTHGVSSVMSWSVGSIELLRVPYFDIPLPADSIGLEDLVMPEWGAHWNVDGQPTVGQAFWVIRAENQTIVVDPCGAADDFIRSGADGLGHQNAAFDLLRAAGVDPASVDTLVFTHLDGIGMAALVDGAPAGSETWSAAFPNAPLIISQAEYDYIASKPAGLPGARAFAALDELGVVRPVPAPFQIAPGVTLQPSYGHSPGHCNVELVSQGSTAVLLGHQAVSPLHAAVGASSGHVDPTVAWENFSGLMDHAKTNDVLLVGPLWPDPGAAKVSQTDPYVLVPSPGTNRLGT